MEGFGLHQLKSCLIGSERDSALRSLHRTVATGIRQVRMYRLPPRDHGREAKIDVQQYCVGVQQYCGGVQEIVLVV